MIQSPRELVQHRIPLLWLTLTIACAGVRATETPATSVVAAPTGSRAVPEPAFAAPMTEERAPAASSDVALRTVPERVYKVRDPSRTKTESWYLNLVVTDARGRKDFRPREALLDIYSGTTLLETQRLPEGTLERMKATSYEATAETDALSLRRRFSLDEVFDFRLAFSAKPVEWQADRVRITLTLETPSAETLTTTLDVPVSVYAQKTALIFPLRGRAIVTQGPINNSGHSGHSNQFAIDVMGLGAEYGPMLRGRKGNAEFVGFGMPVLAPASGTVVYARNDVPDNPPDGDPRDVYAKLPEPLLAVAGNCVVIDHENGEFSALMHLKQGSLNVKAGDSVRQGQAIARLGHSGDAFGPHLHYQLQDGPELFRASSLPAKFENLPNVDLARGVYLEPRAP